MTNILIAAAMLTMGAAPALFAGDLHRDRARIAREDADIRHDRRELRKDLEHGRYRAAARVREDLRHDYAERNRDRRDLRHDYDERWR